MHLATQDAHLLNLQLFLFALRGAEQLWKYGVVGDYSERRKSLCRKSKVERKKWLITLSKVRLGWVHKKPIEFIFTLMF